MMPEIVKKMIPYMLMETDAVAAWLERQVAEGLHLRSVSTLGTAYFRREEPKKLRYGVEFLLREKVKYNSPRRKQLEALGWNYVALYDSTGIYSEGSFMGKDIPNRLCLVLCWDFYPGDIQLSASPKGKCTNCENLQTTLSKS